MVSASRVFLARISWTMPMSRFAATTGRKVRLRKDSAAMSSTVSTANTRL